MSRTARALPSKPAPGLGRPRARNPCFADRDRTAPVPPPTAVPDPGRPPPATTRCGGRPGPAGRDRPPSPVPARPARIRCSAGPGSTAPDRPPSSGPQRVQRLRRVRRPAMTRHCAGAGRTRGPRAGSPCTGPARTGPARTGPARTGPARSGPGRRPVRTAAGPAGRSARTRLTGTRPARRPGTPPRTLAGGVGTSTAQAAAVRTDRPAVARVRRRPPRRTVRAPGEPIHPQAPARGPAPGRSGGTDLPPAQGTAARTAARAARPGPPGRTALGHGRRRPGRPAAGRNPFRDRRTPQAAGRGGSRGTIGGNPPPVRHHGLLRRRTAAVGRLGSGPVGYRASAVCLAPRRPWPWPASGRLRCCLLRPRPRAVRRGARVAWRLPRRPGREPGPRGRAALRAGAGRARRQVGRPGPIAGASSVAGVNRVGGRIQGGAVQLSVLRVAAAVGGFGGPATRAAAWAGRGK